MPPGADRARRAPEATRNDRPITIAGRDITELLGARTFTEAFLLRIDGQLPEQGKTRVVDAVLVALMEHGITPSSLATRLVLDGAPESLSGAVAAGLLAVGSQFLGTIEEAAALLTRIVDAAPVAGGLEAAVSAEVGRAADSGARIPGLGHNLHRREDPRVALLLSIAHEEGFGGDHVAAFELLPAVAEERLSVTLIPNAAGAVGAVLRDLGYKADEVRGFALVARCGGLFGHVLDERRNPIARDVWQSLADE